MITSYVTPAAAVVLPNTSHPVDSCRVDWLSFTAQLHRDEDLDPLADFLADLGDRVMPGARFSDASRGRFYETKHRHESGIQFQYTLPSSSASACSSQESRPVLNSGLCSIEVPGQIWGFLDTSERNSLTRDIRHWPGLKRVTRLDLQATLLNPEQDAEAIVRDVADGKLWPVKFGQGMAYAYRNLHGDLHGACTQYFGGKESRVRYRGYDKGAEAGWKVPAVRHEVQLREEQADQWFRRLADRCETEQSVGPLLMTAEATTVRDALGTLVDFRDTSRWAGSRKPKNWARDSRPPGWWRKVVGPAPVPLEVEYRIPGGLQASVEACLTQYGRRMFQAAFLEALETGDDFETVALRFMVRCADRSNDGDYRELLQLHPEWDAAAIRENWARSVANCKAAMDGSEDESDPAPPC